MLRVRTFFLFFTLSCVCVAQTNNNTTGGSYANPLTGAANTSFGSNDSKSLFGLNIIEYGRGSANSENSVNIEGSKYLFKNWNNRSRIWYNDKILNLDLINYNLLNERFEIKLNNDSIYILNPATSIKKVEINNRVLLPYYNKELQKDSFFEVLWHSDDYSLLSKYKLKIQDGDIDPLTKTYINPKKYVHKKYYFILKNNKEQMVPIKLKKSEILKLIDTSNIDDVKSFVKKRRLKYNNASDVKDILNYYNSIKN